MTNDENHLSFDELSRHADGLSAGDERAVVESHLAVCPMCRDEGADLADAAGSVHTSVRLQKTGADAKAIDAARRWREAFARGEAEDLPGWRRSAVLYLAASLAAAAALVVAMRINRATPDPVRLPGLIASAGLRSIAILPLRNLSGKADDDFMSVGLADAISTRLDRNPSLSMRALPAIVRIQQQWADPRSAAMRLKVDMVLEGEFQSREERMRVHLRLTEARTGQALWAESIDGRRDDLLDLVDQLTTRTESRLNEGPRTANSHAGAGSEPRSSNPRAYEAYVRARSLSGTLVEASYASQVRELRKAIELDPDFAAAHADLAIALELGGLVRGLAPVEDRLSESEEHARLAIALDPRLSDAHLALGRALSIRPSRFPEAMREIVAAIELQPDNIHALQVLTSYFAANGDLVMAQCVSDRIVRLDPFSSEARLRGYWYLEAGDPSEALRQSVHALADPGSALAGHDIRGQAFILQGNLDAAAREADAALQVSPRHSIGESLKAMIAAARGDRLEAESWLVKFDDDARRNHFSAIRVALCRAKLGDREAALDWIERAANLGHRRRNSVSRHPWFAPLRQEPRFQACLERIKRGHDEVRPDVMKAYRLVCPSTKRDQGNVAARDHAFVVRRGART